MTTYSIHVTEDETGDDVKVFTGQSERAADRLYDALTNRYNLALVTVSIVEE